LHFDPPQEGEWNGLLTKAKDIALTFFKCGRKACLALLFVGIILIGITVFILWKEGILDKILKQNTQ
jgi:hypothetical protein